MAKLKATWTIEWTYDALPERYPAGTTIEGMIAIDKASAEDDPELFFSSPDTNEITIEPVKDVADG